MTHRSRFAIFICMLTTVSVLPACNSAHRASPLEQEMSKAALERAQRYRDASRLMEQAQRAEKNEDFDKAVTLYRQATLTYHDLGPAWHNLGVLYMAQDRRLEASQAFRQASDLMPRDPRPPYNMGVLMERVHQMKRAQEYYLEAISREENYQPALRRSIHISKRLLTADEGLAERIDRALMIERDETWINEFERARVLLRKQMEEYQRGM